MNAYELADELKSCIDDGSTDLVCVCGAVNMLRQQADRIAELEDRLSMYEIKDLDKQFQTTDKPVAWLRYKNKNWFLDFPFVRYYTNVVTPEIPLYTHPAKTLTDIGYETVFDGENYTTKLKEPAKTLTDEEIDTVWFSYKGDIKDFARAILKKASEK